jgi:hypothetical protein
MCMALERRFDLNQHGADLPRQRPSGFGTRTYAHYPANKREAE